MRYSAQPRDRIFVKGYGFFSFAKNMGKNIGKNISKNLSVKDDQKLLDHAKKSATDAFKTASKQAIQKTREATGDFIGNKIADRITKLSKNPETVSSEHEKEIPKERYISPEARQDVIDELRLKEHNNRISKIINVSKNSQQNNSEIVTNDNNQEIPKDKNLLMI